MRTAAQAKREQGLIRKLQARALFALGRLRQMQVSAQRRRAAGVLIAGAERVFAESLYLTEHALGAASAKVANQAAHGLHRLGAEANRALAEMEGMFMRAVHAAANGNVPQTEALLAELQEAAAQL